MFLSAMSVLPPAAGVGSKRFSFSLLKVSSLLIETLELSVSVSIGGCTNEAELTLILSK